MRTLSRALAAGLGLVVPVGLGLVGYAALAGRRATRLVPANGRFMDVAGARLHYVDIGSGPAIVLVHGLGGQLRNFTYNLSDQLVKDHRLIIVDRPGSGYSTWTKGQASMGLNDQADALASLITELKLEKPLLVGHSFGGALSLALALRHPQRVAGLALIAPLTQPVTEVSPVFKPLLIKSRLKRRLIAWTLAMPMTYRTREKAAYVVFKPERAPADFDLRGGSALRMRPSAFFSSSSDVSEVSDDLVGMASRYGEIKMPVGILYGRDDAILAVALHGERTAEQISGAEIKVVDGGHMLPITQPEMVASWIKSQADRIAR